MTEAYAIKRLNSNKILLWTVRESEGATKHLFIDHDELGFRQTWEYWESVGYRCVRVTVTEVK